MRTLYWLHNVVIGIINLCHYNNPLSLETMMSNSQTEDILMFSLVLAVVLVLPQLPLDSSAAGSKVANVYFTIPIKDLLSNSPSAQKGVILDGL